jgi:hypothetical protein
MAGANNTTSDRSTGKSAAKATKPGKAVMGRPRKNASVKGALSQEFIIDSSDSHSSSDAPPAAEKTPAKIKPVQEKPVHKPIEKHSTDTESEESSSSSEEEGSDSEKADEQSNSEKEKVESESEVEESSNNSDSDDEVPESGSDGDEVMEDAALEDGYATNSLNELEVR